MKENIQSSVPCGTGECVSLAFDGFHRDARALGGMDGDGEAVPAAAEDLMQMNQAQASVGFIRCLSYLICSLYHFCALRSRIRLPNAGLCMDHSGGKGLCRRVGSYFVGHLVSFVPSIAGPGTNVASLQFLMRATHLGYSYGVGDVCSVGFELLRRCVALRL